LRSIPLPKKKVQPENWIGVIVVTIGLYYLTQPQISGVNIGDFLTLVCAFAWAFYIIYVDVFTNKHDVITLIFIQLWVVAVAAGGLGLALEDFSRIRFTQNEILAFLYMGVLATFVTTILLNRFQKQTSPIRASIIYTWEQPAAVMLAVLTIGEHFSPWQLIGGALMILGILFSETYEFFRNRFVNR
jgi:drug/metabolite transporter (DMT)-like permease